MKKIIAFLTVLMLSLSVIPVVFAVDGVDPIVFDGDIPVQKIYAGSRLTCDIPMRSTDADVKIYSVDILTSTSLTEFPFEMEKVSYRAEAYEVDSYAYHVDLRSRGDVPQDFYEITFLVVYKSLSDGTLTEQSLTMPVCILEAPKTDDSPAATQTSTIPKVIVSSYQTSPKTVVAGEEFELTVAFENTSSEQYINNLKIVFTSADGTFVPVSGSSSIYISSIAPGAIKTSTIKLSAKADVSPASYSASFDMNYDVAGIKDPVIDSERLAIPVAQVPKVQYGKLQITPSDIYVGQEINLMTNVYNIGKSVLYNVTVSFYDPNGFISDGEKYLGNIQPGMTGAVDIYVSTNDIGEADLVMKVTYEDEKGTPYEYYENTPIYVMERIVVDYGDMPEPVYEETDGPGIGKIILIAAAAIVVIVVIVIISKKAKKNKRAKKQDYLITQDLDNQPIYREDMFDDGDSR